MFTINDTIMPKNKKKIKVKRKTLEDLRNLLEAEKDEIKNGGGEISFLLYTAIFVLDATLDKKS